MNYYNYFTEIEETFIRRRGKNLMLSPLDWALMESWQEREVPLHIVLRGIEKVFDTFDAQPQRLRSVKSLAYCKEEVEAQYAEWLERQVGKGGDDAAAQTVEESPVASLERHIADASRQLREAAEANRNAELSEVFARVAGRLDGLSGNIESAEKLELSLEKLDGLLDEALRKTADAELIAQTDDNLASYRGKMEPEVFARTYELMIVKALRDRNGVPRLSLFYL